MVIEREFIPRGERQMGEVIVDLTIENALEPGRRIVC